MTSVFREYLALPSTVKVVAGGRILNSMGSFVVILATPLLTQHLGLSAGIAGAWLFAAQAAFLIGSLAAGWAIDHFSKVWILAATLLANAVAFSVGTFTTGAVTVGISLVIGYFFHGAWRPSMIAIAAEETSEDQHAVAFSLMYFVHNIGYLVAPVAAGWLFAWNARSVFAADAVSSVASAAVVLIGTGTALTAFRVRSRPTDGLGPAEPIHAETGGPGAGAPDGTIAPGFVRTALRDRPLVLFTVAFVAAQFIYSQVSFALPLTIIDRLADSGTRGYGVVMAANAGIVIALAPAITALTRRWRPVTSVALSCGFYLVGFGMLIVVRSVPLFLVSTVLWTIGEILSAIHINVFIASRAPASMRGRYLSSLRVVFALGKIMAPAVGGLVVDRWRVDGVWVVTSLLSVVAVAVLLRVRRMVQAESASG